MNLLLRSLSIGAKLWLAPGLTLLLMLLVAGGGFLAMGQQQHAVIDLVRKSSPMRLVRCWIWPDPIHRWGP